MSWTRLIPALSLAIVLLSTGTLLAAAQPAGRNAPSSESAQHHMFGHWQEKPEWEQFFSANDVTGSFLLYDLEADQYYSFDAKRANSRTIPASTFKVLNSLIALELGTIKDAAEILPWDGTDRGVPVWNQDQSMRQAFQNSTVWFYQELARRAGEDRMRSFVNRVGYGNQNIGGGIDRFWLDGKLRISSREQIEFLVKLHQNALPFSQRSIDIVKDIMIMEQSDTYTLRAKSGWARCWDFLPDCDESLFDPQLGLVIGYVERDGKAYFFAINLDIKKPADAGARMPVTYAILRDMNIIE